MQIKSDKNPLAVLEDEKVEHKEKMQKKEMEMEEVFKKKVKERTWKLEATELELEQAVVKDKQSLAEAREDLYYRKEDFEREKDALESKQRKAGAIRSTESLGRKSKFGFSIGTLPNIAEHVISALAGCQTLRNK